MEETTTSMLDGIGAALSNMPEGDDAAGWVAWFGNALQALINLITQLFAKLTKKGEE